MITSLADLSDLSGVLMISGALLAVIVIVFMIGSRRQMFTRHSGPALDPHEKLERYRQSDEVRDELRETMRELEALARRLSDELDDKTHRIEKLLKEADRRIAALGQGSAIVPPAPPTEPDEPQLDPVAMKVYELADRGKQPLDIARELDEHVGKVELILALRQQVR